MDYFLADAGAVLQDLKTDISGISREEAAGRLLKNGRNELDKQKKKSMLSRLAEQVVNPMVLVLLAAAAVSTIITAAEGGRPYEYAEACVILAVVILNSVLGVVQESKAEKAIEALRQMSAVTARVRRDGAIAQIPAAELVTGDIVLIEAGDSIPADMRLIQCASLRIEEAALTGESVPVSKSVEALPPDEGGGRIPLGDRVNMAYMGSGVAYGRGAGIVTATGMSTEMGRIADIIHSAGDGVTPLQKRLARLSKTLSALVLAICVIIFIIRVISAGAFGADVILDSFMLAISLAVAAIPEGLVAVVTIVLSIGVTNMAKRSAIIRRMTAVETLGCAQVICSDKTGTLTRNLMTVVRSYGGQKLLAKAMALCCDSQMSPDGNIIGDPTENALVAFAVAEGCDMGMMALENPRVAEAPFDSVRKMMTTVHRTQNGYIQYTKGAPDEVLRACTHVVADLGAADTGEAGGAVVCEAGGAIPLTPELAKSICGKNSEYADDALRVLACAYREYDREPVGCDPAILEQGLTFIGLAAMTDPVRPEAKAAVGSCKSAGIKVVMITGDHRDTAVAIAKELGIITSPEQAITGRDLDRMSDAEFMDAVGSIFVYARVQPEHKVRIVNAWKQKGYVTAMTGDGVNDAPAIKSGDIGVGMGITGTDAAKNVSDMVLADDNFATIVSAVEEGRRIYDNIRKTIQFLLSSNLSEVISILAATLLGFVLFKPVHLLYINLVTDSLPAIALGMEHAQPGIMERPPRGMNESVFSGGVGFDIMYQGALIAALTLVSYLIVDITHDHDTAMTAAFLTMSMSEIFHACNSRSQRQSLLSLKKGNSALWLAMAVSFAMSLLVIYVPPLSAVFSLQALSARELAISLGLSIAVIPVVEAVKAVQRAANGGSA